MEIAVTLVGAAAAMLFGVVGYWLRGFFEQRQRPGIEAEIARVRAEVEHQYARLLEAEKARARADVEQELRDREAVRDIEHLPELEGRIALARKRFEDRYTSIDDIRTTYGRLFHEVGKLLRGQKPTADDSDRAWLMQLRHDAREARGLTAAQAEELWDAVRKETDLLMEFFDQAEKRGVYWSREVSSYVIREDPDADPNSLGLSLEKLVSMAYDVHDDMPPSDLDLGEWAHLLEDAESLRDLLTEVRHMGFAIRDRHREAIETARRRTSFVLEKILSTPPF